MEPRSIKEQFQEKIPRSAAKVITWRILVTVTNFLGGWLASGNPWVGLGVAGFALIVNSLLYYFHERAWNRAGWGKEIVSSITPNTF